jgi:hypothetical protein
VPAPTPLAARCSADICARLSPSEPLEPRFYKAIANARQSCNNGSCLDRRQERPLKTRRLETGSRHGRCRKALTDDLDSQVAVCFWYGGVEQPHPSMLRWRLLDI